MRCVPFVLAAALLPFTASAAPRPGVGGIPGASERPQPRTAEHPQPRAANAHHPQAADPGSAGRTFPCGNLVVRYGSACAGSSGQAPRVAISGCPLLGQTFHADVSGGVAGAPAIVVFGTTGRAAVPMGACSLYVMPPWKPAISFTLQRATGVLEGDSFRAGTYRLDVPVPANPSLVGSVVDLQAAVADPSGANGVTLSRGVEITVGF